MTSPAAKRPSHASNPYAPMHSALAAPRAAGGTTGFWRDGEVLVLAHATALPQRCVKCNQPATPPSVPSRLYWHHDWIYALAIVNVAVYLIVALGVREEAQVAAAVCERHGRVRRYALAFGWAGFVTGLTAILYGICQRESTWIWFGAVTAVACSSWGLIRARIIYPTRIDVEHVRLKGCGAQFLASLPVFHRKPNPVKSRDYTQTRASGRPC